MTLSVDMYANSKSFPSILEFAVKIIAAFAALIPFLASLSTIRNDLKTHKRLLALFDDRRIFAVICFGIAYSACSDVAASLIASGIVLHMTKETQL